MNAPKISTYNLLYVAAGFAMLVLVLELVDFHPMFLTRPGWIRGESDIDRADKVRQAFEERFFTEDATQKVVQDRGFPVDKAPSAEEVLASPLARRMIVFDGPRKAMFCPIPKVACTNWKLLFRKFSGYADWKDLSVLHEWDRNGLRRVMDLEPEELQRYLNDSLKIVFVRNPYDRTLSAYLNKFVRGKRRIDSYRAYMANIFGWNYVRDHNLEEEDEPTFEEFMEAVNRTLAEVGDPLVLDEHWAPQSSLCELGWFPYDFVGRFEEYERDSKLALSLLGKGEEHFPTQEDIKFPAGHTAELAAEHETSKTRLLINEIFANDFRLMKYTMKNV